MMKTSVLAVLLMVLSSSAVHAQELKKGNVVGMHVSTIKLADGVTMEKFTAFFVAKAIPAYEKSWPGWKFYPVRRIRGEKAEGFGLIIVIPTEAERDRYYNADGSPSELGKAANAKVQPIADEMNKLGTITADPYIDWLVY
jgi:hypothetical protein